MKKVLINTRIFAIALAVTFTTAFNSPALAIDEKKPIPVEMKFVGNVENQPVFELIFTGTEENEFMIVVRDEFNYELYRDNIKAGHVTKKFLLNTEELGDAAIQFEITDKKSNETVIFEVNKKQSFIEVAVISKRN